MRIWELLLLAAGLAMDAFAVSLCQGLSLKRLRYSQAAIIALCFGFFQAFMPVLGWLLGTQFEEYIVQYDHWIAFALLSFIGGKMLFDAFKPQSHDDEQTALHEKLKASELLLLSVATSIDALAVGVTFAFLQTDIVSAAGIIGIITFAICFVGVLIGHKFGAKFQNKAEIAGGVVLILIGIKILLEHLGVF